MERRPVRLGLVLDAALRNGPGATALADFAVWTRWGEFVGETLARHVQPVRLRRGVLVVRVDDSTWMQELQFLKHDLRARVNAALERTAVREVFLVLADA